MSTLQTVELGVLGPLQVRQYGLPVTIPGAKSRAILTMLGLHGGSVVSADTLVELLWGADPPRTAAKALQTHISSLRRALGDGFVLTEGTGWTLTTTQIDASRYKRAVKMGREAAAAGDTVQAVARFDEALTLWRGVPELPDGARGESETTRWIEGHAALVEDRADALLATGRAAEIIGELEAAVADAPLRERRWGQLMLALYRAGRQGEALGAYQRARSLLADELGVDPGPDLRRLEAAIVAQDTALEMPASQQLQAVTRAVTFLLTDIEGSTAAWEADADAMAVALARHDEIVEQVVTSRGGRLIKTRGEGDATFSVFDRPSAAAAAAIELQEAISHEPWALAEPMRIRVALHTGEVELRDGDYFGRAVNRAARLRSLAAGGQILCSGATAELVIDSLPDDVVLADLGTRQLRNLARPEHVFELRLETADDSRAPTTDAPIERPGLPTVLAGTGPFVGRGRELERLLAAWQMTLAAGTRAVLIAGEPGVGKTRLAGEWSRQAYEQGAVVLYGRCDEDLGAPYQPFAEALRSLVPCLGTSRLRGLRGVEALLPLVPGLADALPDLAAPHHADRDTERYALFDAVVALFGIASASAPVVLILDDLHWAAKPTLLLLRHLLRFGEHARVQIVGTYRSTDLDRSHPLAAMLADLHRDGSANRLQLSGLDEDDVTAYVAEAGYDDEELARALASVTGGNPFFLIEALRHVDESGGRWDPSTLPQGVREAVSRRLSRLPAETNKALAAAAVVGSRFALDLVERVVDDDLVDAFDEACKAGIVIEEPGGRYRFNHAIVRQSLLAELASVRRMRLHQRIAATLETEPGAHDELLAELAYHYFECAWAGNAAKAVDYCRRAADQAMARLAYEGAADLYDKALHALEELDDELPDRDDQQAELLVARCEALLAAGDVGSARGAVSQLQDAARDSERLAAWGTCFDGQVSMLTDPERLDEIESAVGAAAAKLAGLDDAAGEAKAHTVRAGCLARLGRIGDAETALDQALTAARRAGEYRRVNAVLANAPLAALWGPNPVPRAGGRCLDVVRLLRITTGSPVVEATSTRCQGVLDAFRGRAAAGRQLIDSARRSLSELGMRHALLEVDQFAGIVELVADDPASAEPYLRRAYKGFHRMGLDADTAETAALLARACLALDKDAAADELCTESERLAGHALKPSIAWRTVRAQLLARNGAHDEARRMAEDAVAVAKHTDLLVDHGDACLALATVLNAAGDTVGARAAAEQAVTLYERKGAAALAEKARSILGERYLPTAQAPPEVPIVELDNACVRTGERAVAAVNRGDWDEYEQLFAPEVFSESRRKAVSFTSLDVPPDEYSQQNRRVLETSGVRLSQVVIAVRGEQLALCRLAVGTSDVSPGSPRDEFLQLYGIDAEGRIALLVWFDQEDIDTAIAELDAVHARFEEGCPRARRLENIASRVAERFQAHFTARDWDAMADILADGFANEDRRRVVGAGLRRGRDAQVTDMRAIAELSITNITSTVIAIRGERLALTRVCYSNRDLRHGEFGVETLGIVEIDADERILRFVTFDPDDIDAAFAELDARYLADEAASCTQSWQTVMETLGELNRHELGPSLQGLTYADHRRIPFAPGDFGRAIEDLWALVPDARYRTTRVHALDAHGAVVSLVIEGTDTDGNELQWARILSWVFDQARVDVYEEDDLDAALACFEELRPQERRLENAASRTNERFLAHFAARDWDAIGEMLADDHYSNDRRRVTGAGVRHGRDVGIEDMRAVTAEFGTMNITAIVIATRGERLALTRARYSGQDQRPGAFRIDVLHIIDIGADGRIAAFVMFDIDDLDAAFEELDARYLAGEAARHADTWSVIARGYAAANHGELAATAPDVVNIDHRQLAMIESGELVPYLRDTFDELANISTYLEAVHLLTDLGAVVTHVGAGTSKEGFDAEWRMINVIVVRGHLVSRTEVFDEADLDVALTRFDELQAQTRRLDNTASRVDERFQACFAVRDWAAMGEILADDIRADDRRRVVNAGIRHGRDAKIADMRATADLGTKDATSTVIAIRGQRLALVRIRLSGRDQRADAFHTEMLGIVEINADNRMAARILFDVEDIDAAFEELDARYLAGEAAAHAQTWSVLKRAKAALNQRQPPATTPDHSLVDHRPLAVLEAIDLTAYLDAGWALTPGARMDITAVHRLTNLGTVVTWAAHATSQQGFDAEWRTVSVVTIEGDLINRAELFDEADLDAALARFDELSRAAPRLGNAASQVTERFWTYLAARDWDAMAEILADDISTDDRRRVVNAGTRHGRAAEVADLHAIAEVTKYGTSTVIATRGERLALSRMLLSGKGQRPDAFQTELLGIAEINADNRMVARVVFDLDNIDAAFEELDARYLAGEAATHAHTWSVIAGAFAAVNRRELPELASDWVTIDHRRERSFAPGVTGDMAANISALWDQAPDVKVYIEAVHQLTNLGAVVTQAAHGTSQQGFEAEWRAINMETVEGDQINRCELYDEADLEAALGRLDELNCPAPRRENAASQVAERFCAYFGSRSWTAMAEILAENVSVDDRRRVVGAGIRHGREAELENLQTWADVGIENFAFDVIAIRGGHLALCRVRWSGPDQRSKAFHSEALGVLEINYDNQIAARVMFDPEDVDAAFEELDARYVAGEAAEHAHTWSVIAGANAALNRRKLPATTPDWVTIDHQRGTKFPPGHMTAYIRAAWDDTPDIGYHIEAVHRLTNLGAVITHAAGGRSQQGFDAEWRGIGILTVEGNLINRFEYFDEADLDAALARFDELSPPTPRLANAALRVYERLRACIAARDWDAITDMLADEHNSDDRRRVANEGVRYGRDAEIASMRATADFGVTFTSVGVAIRGDRLALCRTRGTTSGPEAFHLDVLRIVEIDANERAVARVVFDPDDIDAAFEELDARYLAGEAAAHAHTWSVVAQAFSALNRREFPATTPDWGNIDHRRGTAFAPGDLIPFVRASWQETHDIRIHIESVHRLSNLGALVTHVVSGTSQEGFDAEWRVIDLLMVDGDLVYRVELFDESDLDAAVARFDERSRPAPRLENAATRTWARVVVAFNRRNVDGFLALTSEDGRYEDRRKGLRDLLDGPARLKVVRAVFETAPSSWLMEVEPIAIRGSRLSLTRECYRDTDTPDRPIAVELLRVMDVSQGDLIHDIVTFDPDDIDAAIEELETRYLAGEAADHAHTWSVIAGAYNALNRREIPATTADCVTIDHRRAAAFAPGDLIAYLRAGWDLGQDVKNHVVAVHRLSNLGAVITHTSYGATPEGFDAEWHHISLLTVEGDLFNRCELFDEAEIDSALAKFDELGASAPQLQNAATGARARVVDALNRHDLDGILALATADGRYDDRRKGLRDEGRAWQPNVVRAILEATKRMQLETEPVAIRGYRLGLTRDTYRDTVDADQPITVEHLTLTEVSDDDLVCSSVLFDSDDINGAMGELTARWIASGEVAYPDVIEAARELFEDTNRHDWDALATREAGATYVNHRQLAMGDADTIVDHWSSVRTMATLIPDMSIELAEVLTHSAIGLVTSIVVKGTTAEGAAIELPAVILQLFDGDRLKHMEAFDPEQRDVALARFEDLNRPA